jgi:hypothetical protein
MTYSLHLEAEQDVVGTMNFYNEQAGPVVVAMPSAIPRRLIPAHKEIFDALRHEA